MCVLGSEPYFQPPKSFPLNINWWDSRERMFLPWTTFGSLGITVTLSWHGISFRGQNSKTLFTEYTLMVSNYLGPFQRFSLVPKVNLTNASYKAIQKKGKCYKYKYYYTSHIIYFLIFIRNFLTEWESF